MTDVGAEDFIELSTTLGAVAMNEYPHVWTPSRRAVST
jgi:hypothetical protein